MFDEVASLSRPVRDLKYYEKQLIKPGESATFSFTIRPDESLSFPDKKNTKVLEDGAETAEKENLSQLAARQLKYITNLENALVRIRNRTYGICTVTGKLIPKDRLIAVPHTTQSIEAKMMQQD